MAGTNAGMTVRRAAKRIRALVCPCDGGICGFDGSDRMIGCPLRM